MGDFIPDNVFSFQSSPPNLITSVTNTVGVSVRSIDINHNAIPFKHRVFLSKYSLGLSTFDNDETTNHYWVIDPENDNTGRT